MSSSNLGHTTGSDEFILGCKASMKLSMHWDSVMDRRFFTRVRVISGWWRVVTVNIEPFDLRGVKLCQIFKHQAGGVGFGSLRSHENLPVWPNKPYACVSLDEMQVNFCEVGEVPEVSKRSGEVAPMSVDG